MAFFILTAMSSPLAFVLYETIGLGWWYLLALGVLAVLCQGSRWRVTIGVEGVVLERWIGWIWPQKTRRFLLDARIQSYETWEDVYAEGFEIADYPYWNEASGCFGPAGDSAEHDPLLVAMQAALEDARACVEQAKSHAAPRLRHWLLSGSPAFDARSASWHRSMSGRALFENRVHEIRSGQDVTVANITIPAHSTFTFNTDLSTDSDA